MSAALVDLESAHKHSIYHRDELERSEQCSCFYCMAAFSTGDIANWTDDGSTALCPKCGIDAVIGSASGFAASDGPFLTATHNRWFEASNEAE